MERQAGTNNDLLTMALVGYEAEKAKIDTAIGEIRGRLTARRHIAAAQRKRWALRKAAANSWSFPGWEIDEEATAAARRRIAAAQRKRWAAVKKSKAQAKSAATPTAPKKRKMSAAARKRIGDAARKRWAAARKAGGKKGKAGKAAAS